MAVQPRSGSSHGLRRASDKSSDSGLRDGTNTGHSRAPVMSSVQASRSNSTIDTLLALPADCRGGFAVTLVGRNELDAAVAVPMLVQVHKSRHEGYL